MGCCVAVVRLDWASPLEDADVQEIVESAVERIVRLLQRRGLLDDSQVDELTEAEPLQAALAAASVQGQLATGERAGQRVRRLCPMQRKPFAAHPCASPPAASRCMQPPASTTTTAPAWNA